MGKFRKKPVVIEAVQFTGGNYDDLRCFVGPVPPTAQRILLSDGSGVEVRTLEGDMLISPGDWLIRGVAGEFYPCKPDIFGETYEAVEE